MLAITTEMPSGFQPLAKELDVVQELLCDKRSLNTRTAYEKDLRDFFRYVAGVAPNPAIVQSFLLLSRFEAIALVLRYKASLVDKGLANQIDIGMMGDFPATINMTTFQKKFPKITQ